MINWVLAALGSALLAVASSQLYASPAASYSVEDTRMPYVAELVTSTDQEGADAPSTGAGSAGGDAAASDTSGTTSEAATSTATTSSTQTASSTQVTVDWSTGQVTVGDQQFLLGVDQTPLASSGNVGDPDNFFYGSLIGTLLGSLFGDPGLGLLLGTIAGSNLIEGFTLEDFNIEIVDGVPIIDGFNPFDPTGDLGDLGVPVPGSGIIPGAGGGGGGGGFGSGGMSSAQGATNYYGGDITQTEECCYGTLVHIDDYKSGQTLKLVYQPGISRQYDYENPTQVGAYIMGSYSQGGVCLDPSAECESEKENDGLMDSMPGAGTSR